MGFILKAVGSLNFWGRTFLKKKKMFFRNINMATALKSRRITTLLLQYQKRLTKNVNLSSSRSEKNNRENVRSVMELESTGRACWLFVYKEEGEDSVRERLRPQTWLMESCVIYWKKLQDKKLLGKISHNLNFSHNWTWHTIRIIRQTFLWSNWKCEIQA